MFVNVFVHIFYISKKKFTLYYFFNLLGTVLGALKVVAPTPGGCLGVVSLQIP